MQRFFSKVNKTDSCWKWIGSLRSGYGAFKYKGKTLGAHRFSWELHMGSIPEGLIVCHKCDNRKCVNPEHLFLGTYKDNMEDCSRKGRIVVPNLVANYFPVGNIPRNRLVKTREEINVLKLKILNRKSTLKELSKELGLPFTFIKDLSSGRTYKNV